MKPALFLAALLALGAPVTQTTVGPERFDMRVVATGLGNPWDLQWGADGRIWVSERAGKRITRIDPTTGERTVAVTIDDVVQTHAQDGLLGLAFHPDFLKGTGPDYLYVVLTYDADPGPALARRMRIRRYTYTRATGTLGAPEDLVSGLPAGSDHVGGRLAVGTDRRLYLTVGDGGFNQLSLYCQPIHAQDLPTAAEVAARDWTHYEGKMLRLDPDGAVPADNPVLKGVRSHIYSYGHRNPQGIAVGPGGRIYASEHGPSMDDELNLLRPGGNYGWPHVAGYRDDNTYVYAEWGKSAPEPCASLKYNDLVAPPSVPQAKETAWNDPAFTPPIQTFFTPGATYDFKAQGNATIAPSGIDVYTAVDGIPGWANSILVTSLIKGTIYRVKLNAAGDGVVGVPLEYFKLPARYRDVLVAPDGRTIYAIADAGSQQSPQSILAFTYRP